MKYLSEVFGKGCIVARVVADSFSTEGGRIVTFELEYPRFIHSEFMTHRLFSRNAMSSRAVPIEKMIEQVRFRPAMPIEWGKNTKGMQAKELFSSSIEKHNCEWLWLKAAKNAADQAEDMMKFGLHKQIVNRVLEPFQVMKTVMTSTELDNFFYLRRHPDAQPEIRELADCMYEASQKSTSQKLFLDEWHIPYVTARRKVEGVAAILAYFIEDENGEEVELDVEDALKVSASCCAQVSYRLLDNSLEKAINIYDRLVESKPVHASPFEHQATPAYAGFHHGATHTDFGGNIWSGNFKNWIQHRQRIAGHVCNKYGENNV